MWKVILSSWPLRSSIGLYLLACLPFAYADETYVRPTVKIGAEYNDNYPLEPIEALERDGWGTFADLAVDIGTETLTRALWVTPRFVTGAYDDDFIDEEREGDYYLSGGYRYKGETYRVSFQPGWSRESVLRSEIPDVDSGEVTDPNDITDGNGRITRDIDRDRWDLPLKVDYSISPTQRLNSAITYTDVSYDSGATGVTDFTQTRVALGYSHSITERDWVTIGGAFLRYEPETDLNGDVYELVGRWQRNFSEVWWTYAEAGAAFSNVDVRRNGQVTEDDQTNPLLRAGIVRVQERSRLRLEAGSYVLGTSSGDLRDRIEAKIVYDRNITRRWTLLGTLLAFDEEATDSANTRPEELDRTYVRARAGLGFSLRPAITLRAEYVYTYEDEGLDVGGDAKSNGVLFTVIYQPEKPRR